MPQRLLVRRDSRSCLACFQALKNLTVLLLVLPLWCVGGCAGAPHSLMSYREARPLMGTLVEIMVPDAEPAMAKAAIDAAFRRMSALSDTMNHYDPSSQVSRINMNAGRGYTAVSPELCFVLDRAAELSQRTQGAFDISIAAITGWRFDPDAPSMPTAEAIARQRQRVNYRDVELDCRNHRARLRRAGMRIDLGGIAKLPILNWGLQVMRQHGIRNVMLNGGGDIVTSGLAAGRAWHIGIRDPWHPDALYAEVDIGDGFIATSGDYERYFMRDGRRYHHILDPRTGFPTRELRQVTLIGKELDKVNGLSAAIMVLGLDAGKALIESFPGLNGILMHNNGSVWVSRGLTLSAPNRGNH